MQNSHNVAKVSFEKKLELYCPLGRQLYTALVECAIECLDTIPDYCIVDTQLDKLAGDMLTVEELARSAHNIVKAAFGGARVKTTVAVGQSKHFPVTVEVSD